MSSSSDGAPQAPRNRATPNTEPSDAASPTQHDVGISRAVVAGIVCGVVGFTSSFAVVLTGLRAVGASPNQAASGLCALCVTMGIGCIFLSLFKRMPITSAWSTPGAALLAAMTAPHGGFPTAVGAFIVSGILIVLCGLVAPLERLVEKIPTPLASAMLAGTLLTICTHPFLDLKHSPREIGIVLAVWAIGYALWRRWAVLVAFAAALVVMAFDGSFHALTWGDAQPRLTLVAPHFDLMACVAIGVPLFLVTMTSQNVPGIAVLASFGYRPGLRTPLRFTGAASIIGALAGGHAVNLSAISAALAAGPEAHPDKNRRWVAGVVCGIVYILFGPLSALVANVAVKAPEGLLTCVAAVALLPTFASAAHAALKEDAMREAGAIALVVAASGVTFAGIGSAFWSLVAGGIMLGLTRLHQRRA